MYDMIGLPGNILVIVVIILESRFHVMRYVLLASLALSDFLLLIPVSYTHLTLPTSDLV